MFYNSTHCKVLQFSSHIYVLFSAEVLQIAPKGLEGLAGKPDRSATVAYATKTELCWNKSLLFLLLLISFMQGIYNYTSATNHVLEQYSVASIL